MSAASSRLLRASLLSSISILSVFAFFETAALAQSGQPAHLGEIVVSATAIPTPAKDIASAVTVITSDQIEREQRRTLPDALATVPGLNIVQTGGPGGQTSVFMRGTNSNHVKVIVDGVEMNDPSTPNRSFDFGQMLTQDIERIEVLRGPQSGLYGANALGGVIAITTKRGNGKPQLSAMIEGGSYGTFNQSLDVSGGDERFDYAFNIAHYSASSVPVTPPSLIQPGVKILGNGYDNWSYSARLGFQIAPSLRVNATGRYSDGYLLVTGDSGWPSRPSAFRSSQDYKQALLRGEVVWDPFDGRFVNRFGVSYTNQLRSNRTPDALGQLGAASIYQGERISYDWRGDLKLIDGHTLVMGLQHDTERLISKALRASNTNLGGFLELQSRLSEQFFLAANLRYDHDERFGGHVTYRIAPTYTIEQTGTKLKASYGTGFKAPTLSERFVDYRPAFNFFGNPDLKPEQSRGWDIGFEQPLFNERVRIGASYFHNDIDNLIATNAAGNSYTNIGKAQSKGIEAFASVQVTPEWRIRGDYTYTLARDVATNLELLRRPRHKCSLGVEWKLTERFTASATVLYVGDWIDGNRDFSIRRLTAPGYTTVNLAMDYKYNDALTLFGRVDNLFDKRYEDPTGFMRPGLSAFGGIKVKL